MMFEILLDTLSAFVCQDNFWNLMLQAYVTLKTELQKLCSFCSLIFMERYRILKSYRQNPFIKKKAR